MYSFIQMRISMENSRILLPTCALLYYQSHPQLKEMCWQLYQRSIFTSAFPRNHTWCWHHSNFFLQNWGCMRWGWHFIITSKRNDETSLLKSTRPWNPSPLVHDDYPMGMSRFILCLSENPSIFLLKFTWGLEQAIKINHLVKWKQFHSSRTIWYNGQPMWSPHIKLPMGQYSQNKYARLEWTSIFTQSSLFHETQLVSLINQRQNTSTPQVVFVLSRSSYSRSFMTSQEEVAKGFSQGYRVDPI